MKTLKTLIKINQSNLDKKRTELLQIEEQYQELTSYYNNMEDDLNSEMKIAQSDPSIAMSFNGYRDSIRSKQETITKILAQLQSEKDILIDQISAIYRDVKKYETILDKKILEAKEKEKIKENQMLDEIALNKYLES